MALLLTLSSGLIASSASAEPVSMAFTEGRANVGVQLADAALFAPPEKAPFKAQIEPASGSIAGGVLEVPEFSTHITDPVNADVTVEFEIGTISGSFQSTGALALSGEAGGILRSEGKECIVSTEPAVLTLTTAGGSGGANPRFGVPFASGLAGAGAVAGQWSDMHAAPIAGDTTFCDNVEAQIGGPGGIWLKQDDIVPPSAPQLTQTDPASPDLSGAPRIIGAAEAGSTVRLYAGAGCTGTPVAMGSAAELGSPGITVEVAAGATAAFSATATDAANNVSDCSTPISYTYLKPAGPDPLPPPTRSCVVPKLRGKTLVRARASLKAAGCKLGTVRKPRGKTVRPHRVLVVRSSSPQAGARPADGKVDLTLGPRARKARR